MKGKKLWGRRVSCTVRPLTPNGQYCSLISLASLQSSDTPPVPQVPRPYLDIVLPFEAKSAPSSPAPVPAVLPTSAARGLIESVTQQYAEREQQNKESGLARMQALTNARLSVEQCTEAIKMAAEEVKQRGLATVGILRPFRSGANPNNMERLVELFLLCTDQDKYKDVLSISSGGIMKSDLAMATFGTPSPNRELSKQMAYANIHDVADFLKWALRRVQLGRRHFNAPLNAPSGQWKWYEDFVEKEKAQEYPQLVFRDVLLPALPAPTAVLLTTLLDLVITVSAHYVANGMPASRICRILGYWVFGRIDEDKTFLRNGKSNSSSSASLEEFVSVWDKSAAIMEHLLLARLRMQAAQTHFMPTRLTELIANYPYIHLHSPFGAPSLRSTGKARNYSSTRALWLQLSTQRNAQTMRGEAALSRAPHDLLATALSAPISSLAESSAEQDDWTSLLERIKSAERVSRGESSVSVEEPTTPISFKFMNDTQSTLVDTRKPQMGNEGGMTALSEEELQKIKESAILRDEDVQLLEIVRRAYMHRRRLMGLEGRGGSKATNLESPLDESNGSTSKSGPQTLPRSFKATSKRLSILPEESQPVSRSSTLDHTKSSPRSRRATLKDDDKRSRSNGHVAPSNPDADWSSFSQGGFGTPVVGKQDLKLFDAAAELEKDRLEASRDSSIGERLRKRASLKAPPRLRSSRSTTALNGGECSPTKAKASDLGRPPTSASAASRRGQKHGSIDLTAIFGKNHPASPLDKGLLSPAESPAKITSIMTLPTPTLSLEEPFLSFWQDTLLEFNSTILERLPRLVFVQLNREARTSCLVFAPEVVESNGSHIQAQSTGSTTGGFSSLSSPTKSIHGGVAAGPFGNKAGIVRPATAARQNGNTQSDAVWLLIEETVLPPPSAMESNGSGTRSKKSKSKKPSKPKGGPKKGSGLVMSDQALGFQKSSGSIHNGNPSTRRRSFSIRRSRNRIEGDDEDDSDGSDGSDEGADRYSTRTSMFSPSIRSLGASLFRRRPQFKMPSRSASSAGQRNQQENGEGAGTSS